MDLKQSLILILLILGIKFSGDCQQKKDYNFKIREYTFRNYPELSIDFSFYTTQQIYHLLDSARTGGFRLYENGAPIDSFSLQSVQKYQKYNLFLVADFTTKKDSATILKNIEKFVQFSPNDSAIVDSWLMLQKQNSVVALALSEAAGLAKKDTFALNVNVSLFINFINENHLLSDNNIFVFVLNNPDSIKQNLIAEIARHSTSHNAPLVGILNLSEDEKAADEIIAKAGNLPFVRKKGILERKKEDVNIAPLIKGWTDRHFQVSFQTLAPMQLESYKEYRFVIQNDTISFHWDIPLSVIEEYFMMESTRKIESLISAKALTEAMDLIIETSNKLKTVEMNTLAWRVIKKHGEHLAQNKTENTLDNYLAFESRWQETAPDDYSKTRLQLFKKFYQNPDNQSGLFSEKVALANKIYEAEPTPENKLTLTIDEAHLFYSENKLWQAVEKLHKAILIKKTDETNQLLKDWLFHTFNSEFEQQEFTNLTAKGETYAKWYKSPFLQHYILAEAYRETSDFLKAQKQYEWLIDNWRNQNTIDWFDAFGKLQEMLCLNYKFDEAIEINQRLYRSKENSESVELSLFIARAKMLKPVIDVFPDAVRQSGSFTALKNSVQLKPVVFPEWLTGIVLADAKMNTVTEFYKTEDYKSNPNADLTRFKNFPVIEMDIAGNNFWMINRINGNHYVVLHISNYIRNEQEKTILDEIVKSKMDETNWVNLFRLEERAGIKFSTQMMTVLWEAQLAQKGNISFPSYWERLKTNSFIRFITWYSESGSIKSFGQPLPEGSYQPGDYKRSAKTVAYYEQIIKDNNQTYFDITNPVFNENSWKGAVRIGVESYYE